MSDLPLTGERTVPGLARENYWFRRHEVAYQWIVEQFPVTGHTVVDAGSGEGYGAELLRAAGAHRVVALEYDSQASAHSRTQYPRVQTVRANLDSLPLATGTVDVVVTMQVIEHLWNLAGFLGECHRVLKPGGLLIAATPNRLTFSPGLGRGTKPTNPFHVEEFDAEQLKDLLAEAGFTDVALHGVHHGPGIASDLVDRQIAAALTQDWPAELTADVAAVQVSDFHITTDQLASSLDLIGIGRVRGRS